MAFSETLKKISQKSLKEKNEKEKIEAKKREALRLQFIKHKSESLFQEIKKECFLEATKGKTSTDYFFITETSLENDGEHHSPILENLLFLCGQEKLKCKASKTEYLKEDLSDIDWPVEARIKTKITISW